MNVERTFDTELIKGIMSRADMWDTVAEDGQDPDDYAPDVNGECWLLLTVDDKPIGAYCVHQRNAVTLEIHAQVLPEFRKEHSTESGTKVLKWILDNTECQKVIAQIPAIYPNVKRFTESFGFQVEGENRMSYLKNGELHNQWLLGITREEIRV